MVRLEWKELYSGSLLRYGWARSMLLEDYAGVSWAETVEGSFC